MKRDFFSPDSRNGLVLCSMARWGPNSSAGFDDDFDIVALFFLVRTCTPFPGRRPWRPSFASVKVLSDLAWVVKRSGSPFFLPFGQSDSFSCAFFQFDLITPFFLPARCLPPPPNPPPPRLASFGLAGPNQGRDLSFTGRFPPPDFLVS